MPDEGLALQELSPMEAAARLGESQSDFCDFEYPCLVQPLDLVLYAYQWVVGEGRVEYQ